MKTTSLSILAIVLASCGGGSATAPPPATATEAEPVSEPPPADMAFDDMTKNQRAAFMKHVVLPEMKAAFTTLDPKYADADCRLCHGKGAEDKTFKMPNPDLPRLPTTKEGFDKLAQEKPKVLQFMAGTVKPRMAALLKQPEYDPATGQGEFGCQKCHVMGEGEAP
jgi:hypothetical protein